MSGQRWEYYELVCRGVSLSPEAGKERAARLSGFLHDGWELMGVASLHEHVNWGTPQAPVFQSVPGLIYTLRREARGG